jgi:hypothetical protein
MELLRSLPVRATFTARALATAALAVATAGGVVAASAPAAHADGTATYTYTTLNNSNDLTFNQLLGINDSGVIAGYFGSGMAMHAPLAATAFVLRGAHGRGAGPRGGRMER